MKKYLIIYHREDNDGVVSCGLFYHYLINNLHINKDDIELLGADYNFLANYSQMYSPADLHNNYENIIVTDVSFNDAKYMNKLAKEFKNNMIWVDHHKPIIDASYSLGFDFVPGIRDTQRSAILNAWKFLYDQFDEAYNKDKKSLESVPELLRILSAYDSWTYEREGYDIDFVRYVNTGFTETTNLDVNNVLPIIDNLINIYVNNDYVNDNREKWINEYYNFGKQINTYEQNKMKRILAEEGDTSWKIVIDDNTYTDSHGIYVSTFRPACAIFYQGPTNSQMFDSVKEKCANGIVFKHQKNGNWVVSLYNCDNDNIFWDNSMFHCGEYMKKKYGGGGHAGAAGCTLTEKQMIKILKEKTL